MGLVKRSIQNRLMLISLSDLPPHDRSVLTKTLYRPDDDAFLWKTATQNGISSIVAHALMEALGPNNIPLHWRHAHKENYFRISAYLDELNGIANRLAAEGVTVVLIENGALAKAVYHCPGCSEFSDLDLLVRREQISATHRVLTTSGYTTCSDGSLSQDAPDLSNGRAEYLRMLANGYPLRLNLQWSLVARRWFDAKQEPDVETLMGRSVPIAGSAVRMLCPEDNLFQLAIHNACHAYVRKPGIRLHLDIERFVRRVSLDWAEFVELVERYRVRTPVYFSLAIPKVLFDTPIPDEVFAALHPPVWKEWIITHWLQRLDLFSPDERKFSNLGLILFKLLLYDDVWGLWYAIFPDSTWMCQRYGFQSDLLLPAYHARRLIDLTLRRRP